jgi:hypothetical protein
MPTHDTSTTSETFDATSGATLEAATLETPAAETKRARGRPRKPTPTKVAFDARVHSSTIATIKAIPKDRRNAVRDAAISGVDRIKSVTVTPSHKVIFGKLAMEIRWSDGVFLLSNAWLAKECGTSQRTVERAFEAFRDARWVSRFQRMTKAGDPQTCETTIPLFAQVWAEMRAQQTAEGVPTGNSGVPTGNSNSAEGVPTGNSDSVVGVPTGLSGGTATDGGQPSVLAQEAKEKKKKLPSSASPMKVTHDSSASREVPAAPAPREEDDRPWHAPHLLGWLDYEDSRTARVYFGDASTMTDEIEAEVARAFPDDVALREMMLDACDGRLGRQLRTKGGMYTVRRLAAGIMAHAREILPDGGLPDDPCSPVTPRGAMRVVAQAMHDRIGNRPGEWLNSYALIGQRLACEMYTSCIIESDMRGYQPRPVTEEDLAAGNGEDALRIVVEAGGWKVLAPELRNDARGLLEFLDFAAAKHGRLRTEVLEVVVTFMRRAAATGWRVGSQQNKEVTAWPLFEGIAVPPQPNPQPAASPREPSEAEVQNACNWLRNYLGDRWHNSQRLKGAAKEVGISREACRAAMERVERQTVCGPNYQWITAMPGIPLPMADDGDIIGTLKAADHNRLVANRLYRQGSQPLLAYVRAQAEEHGCTQDDVVNIILDVLRRAASQEFGARQRILESMIGSNCGVGKPRYDIAHWIDFDRLIADAIRQKRETA